MANTWSDAERQQACHGASLVSMRYPDCISILCGLGARESNNAWLAEEGEVGVVETKVFHISTRAFVILLRAMYKLGILASLIIALANVLVLVLGHHIAHSVVHGDGIISTGAIEPAASHGLGFADIIGSCPLALLLLHLISSPLSSGSKHEWSFVDSLHGSECEQDDGDNECTVAEHGGRVLRLWVIFNLLKDVFFYLFLVWVRDRGRYMDDPRVMDAVYHATCP